MHFSHVYLRLLVHTSHWMDDKWFKEQQRRAGVTAEEIAREMGRDRSVVSRIYTGRQVMSLEWGKAFAKVLGVPLDEVLSRAGVLQPEQAQTTRPGFAESDVTPFRGAGQYAQQTDARARLFGGGRPGVDVWTLKSAALSLMGYMPGDMVLLDTHLADRCIAGDVVIAQRYNAQSGTAETLLRRYEPPVLVAASANPDERRVLVVDGENVAIRGKVIASWRM